MAEEEDRISTIIYHNYETGDIGAPIIQSFYHHAYNPETYNPKTINNSIRKIEKTELPKVDFTRMSSGYKQNEIDEMLKSDMEPQYFPFRIQEFFKHIEDFKNEDGKKVVIIGAHVLAHIVQSTREEFDTTIFATFHEIKGVRCLVVTKPARKAASQESYGYSREQFLDAIKLGIVNGWYLTSPNEGPRFDKNDVVDYHLAVSTLTFGDVKLWILAEIDGIYSNSVIEIKLKQYFSQLDCLTAYFAGATKCLWSGVRAIDIIANGIPAGTRVKLTMNSTLKMISEHRLFKGNLLIVRFFEQIFAYYEKNPTCKHLNATKKSGKLYFQLDTWKEVEIDQDLDEANSVNKNDEECG